MWLAYFSKMCFQIIKDNRKPSKKWLRQQWKNQQAVKNWWKSFDLKNVVINLRAANTC